MNNQLQNNYALAIETLLRQSIGLEANSIGSRVIAGAVDQRRIRLGLTDLQAYYTYLQTNLFELEELTEAVVVPETWFFRDREPFNYLGKHLKTEWLTAPYTKIFNILSAPCATGEEPYSIAITLLEAGLATTSFRIEALDISKAALAKARKAIYSHNSFRGEDNSFRDHYFQLTPGGYQLSEAIATTVNFRQGNLLDMGLSSHQEFYDVIFCRNVLIYFDAIARARTIEYLHYLLKPKGLLFVGHSETGSISTCSKFTPIRHPLAFAYQKVSRANPLEPPLYLPPPPKITTHHPPLLPKTSKKNVGLDSQLKPILEPILEPIKNNLKSVLIKARDLADQGHLEAAISLCETYLQQNRTSAEAHHLLGELHQAQGYLEQAELNFEKAIYLNPHLEEALVHLALIKEQQGDLNRAAVIWQRVQRLQK